MKNVSILLIFCLLIQIVDCHCLCKAYFAAYWSLQILISSGFSSISEPILCKYILHEESIIIWCNEKLNHRWRLSISLRIKYWPV